jgi:very-short-patch-repair endonuclease
MKRLTQDEFISKCKEKHGNRYDYSKVEYKNISSKIIIICREHGDFKQIAKNHKDGQGCPTCSGSTSLNKYQFLEKCDNIKYDYSLIEDRIIKSDDYIKVIHKETNLTYIQLSDHHKNGLKPTKIESNSLVKKFKEIHNNKFDYLIEKETYYSTDKIKIINKLTNDEFYYRVDRHLKGMKPNKVTINYFLFKSKELHGDKYDYSLIESIKGNSDKVEIICKEHGVFSQRVSNHINLGDGCPKCSGVGKWNTELLISEFKNVHNNTFDYSYVKFENVGKKVKIICKDHGLFEQNIHKHLKGQGCPECSYNSKGEEYVKMYLDQFEIKYIRQHSFDTCRYINRLSFDFYLPELKTCIEFDGIQHFKPINDFGGKNEFKNIQKRDNCKNKWCEDNNIKLIRIKYNEIDRIKYILEKLQKVEKK